MPKINKYKNKSGYYIRSAFEGFIVTYQITTTGEQFLKNRGIDAGDIITTDDLLWMKERGYITTGGSGPGEIDPGTPLRKARRRRKRKKNEPGCCCPLAIVVIGFVPTAIFSTIWLIRYSHKAQYS